MEWIHSVRFRILIGFAAVVAPLLFFLVYNNYYAMNAVRQQVSENYSSLLEQFAQNNDSILREVELYLHRLESQPEFNSMYAYGIHSNEYVETKLRILNQLISGTGYNYVTSMFTYSRQYDDFLLASPQDYARQEAIIRSKLPQMLAADPNRWHYVETAEGPAIVKIVAGNADLYLGAWINVDDLVSPLREWNLGGSGSAFLLDEHGDMITPSVFTREQYGLFRDRLNLIRDGYRIEPSTGGDRHLFVSQSSRKAAVRYVLAIPETSILRNLPYFRKAVYVIPFGVAFLLFLYLILVQRALVRPLGLLVRGMRRIGQGKLDVRLPQKAKGEFALLNSAFNDMAGQIENLKIHVYEEKLRVQHAEFKHLQVQINPHFYMNSLNIIYTLAALKDFRLTQKMALHLADYFRFIVQTNKPTITLEEELRHIENYLEIQRIRFPDNLTFTIEVEPDLARAELPPLVVQPFAENAIVHGFKRRKNPFHVAITARRSFDEVEEKMEIVISDTGVGFPEKMLQRFQSQAWSEVPDDHVGIWNVLRRLNLRYGDGASVRFGNAEQGAVVTVVLPLQGLQGASQKGKEHDSP